MHAVLFLSLQSKSLFGGYVILMLWKLANFFYLKSILKNPKWVITYNIFIAFPLFVAFILEDYEHIFIF